MTRTLLIPLTLAVSVMLLPNPGFAQERGKPNPEWRKILEKYDADKDGKLSEEERDAIRKDIREGRLTLPEGMRKQGGQPERGQGAKPGQRQAPAFDSDQVNIERDIEYGRAGDRALLLDMVRPKQPSAERLPVIVFIHGGGWRNGDKAGGVARVGEFAASGNYVGVSVGYRLSGEAIWPAQINDCKAAIRFLRANAAKYGIDPDRIGVWGSSAGGHLVNMLGVSGDVKELEGDCGTPGVSSRVTCVVPFCGPTDFVGVQRVEGGREPSAVSALLGGNVDEKKEEAKMASPITHVSADDPPFLIVHGTADPTVPYDQAKRFCEALQKAGVNVNMVSIEGGGHGIGGPEVIRRVKAFFDKHLRGQEAEIKTETIQAPETPAAGKAR